jgi:hypothetical protein
MQKPRDKTKLNIENIEKESIVRKYKQTMMTKLNTVTRHSKEMGKSKNHY